MMLKAGIVAFSILEAIATQLPGSYYPAVGSLDTLFGQGLMVVVFGAACSRRCIRLVSVIDRHKRHKYYASNSALLYGFLARLY